MDRLSIVISKKFLVHSSLYTLAGMLPMASAIILLPFYIHYLSASLYGALSLYLVFSLFVQMLGMYSFDTSVYIHYHEFKGDREKLSVFVSSSFNFILLLGGGVAVLSLVSGEFVFGLLPQSLPFFPYGALAMVTGIAQAVFKVHNNLLQTREKPETFLWANLFSFLLMAVLTIIGLHLYPGTLLGPILGRMVPSVLGAGWALFRVFREFGFHFDFAWLRQSFQFNHYNFIYQVQQWAINYFDRILIAVFMPLAAVGIYDATVKCLYLIELLVNALHNSFYPTVIGLLAHEKEKKSTPGINRYYHGLTATTMVLVSLLILFLPIGVDWMVKNQDYRQAIPFIPFLAVIYLFRPMRIYFGMPYGVLKYTKPLALIYLVVSVTKIALMAFLLPSFSIYGIVMASLVSSLLDIALLKSYLSKHFTFIFNPYKIFVAPALMALVILALETSWPMPNRIGLHVSYVVGCVGVLFWVYRKEIPLINPFIKKPII